MEESMILRPKWQGIKLQDTPEETHPESCCKKSIKPRKEALGKIPRILCGNDLIPRNHQKKSIHRKLGIINQTVLSVHYAKKI